MRRLTYFFLMAGLWLSACAGAVELHGSVYEEPTAAPSLDLLTTEREAFQLEEMRGKIVLVFFGYTSCPDVCPATLSEVKWVFQQMGAGVDQVEFLFVTVDPERDTPEVIAEHLDRFSPRFVGLWGTEEELARAREVYGVYAARDPSEADFYTMTHTSRIFLIDQDGLLRTNYTFDETAETILTDVSSLLGG